MRYLNLILVSTLSLLNMGVYAQIAYTSIQPQSLDTLKDLGTLPATDRSNVGIHKDKIVPAFNLVNGREILETALRLPGTANPAFLKSGVLHRAIALNEKRQVHNADYTSSSPPSPVNEATEVIPAEPPHTTTKTARNNFKDADDLARELSPLHLNDRNHEFRHYEERVMKSPNDVDCRVVSREVDSNIANSEENQISSAIQDSDKV